MSKSNNEPLKAALPLGILATTNASFPWLTARSSGVIRPLCLLVRKMDVSLEAQTKSLATLSAFSYIPPRRNEPKEMSYFNTKSKKLLTPAAATEQSSTTWSLHQPPATFRCILSPTLLKEIANLSPQPIIMFCRGLVWRAAVGYSFSRALQSSLL
ncbi:hypothetical protein AMECASPLE_013914 [Ameca splendens]|uniref:Uncharacterized protein n=1 Tax=Ameca splendens TaxID=208324 RepID=A0ABV0ZN27_9TELE